MTKEERIRALELEIFGYENQINELEDKIYSLHSEIKELEPPKEKIRYG